MIIKKNCWIQPLQRETTLHIYLPDEAGSTAERYPVMYMLDGQNLYLDEEATYGKSWNIASFLESYDKKMIIVGIECDHRGRNRLSEYCPYTVKESFLGAIEGKGQLFFDWVFGTLKPEIDRTYPTWPFREGCGVGGSSMGGLMALYAALHYNQLVSKAACLSPSFAICEKQLRDELKDSFLNPDTRIYLSFGSKEMGGNIEDAAHRLNEMSTFLKEKGAILYSQIIQGGAHNEASWEKENPDYFDFLWKSTEGNHR